jgi:hypothetical protein
MISYNYYYLYFVSLCLIIMLFLQQVQINQLMHTHSTKQILRIQLHQMEFLLDLLEIQYHQVLCF